MAKPNVRNEMNVLHMIILQRRNNGIEVPNDVATHAALLVANGWTAADAIGESARTLDDAEMEGGY